MRKIIGIGETILDIIFKNNQPSKAVPGGSTFNTMVSLGRLQVPCCFLSEIGQDHIGNLIKDFMRENNLSPEYLSIFSYGKTPISLAFLNDSGDASYTFYSDFPENRLDIIFPRINENDIVIFGSYFSINPLLREKVTEILEYAKDRKAIIYYDPNFRSAHAHDSVRLMPAVLENLEYADIVRGSAEDFENLFHLSDPKRIYDVQIKFYCPQFIFTGGANGVELFTKNLKQLHFDVMDTQIKSTIGAGDNFNAGVLFGLLKYDITKDQLNSLTEEEWSRIIKYGLQFSSHVCGSYDNYISRDFAENYANQ